MFRAMAIQTCSDFVQSSHFSACNQARMSLRSITFKHISQVVHIQIDISTKAMHRLHVDVTTKVPHGRKWQGHDLPTCFAKNIRVISCPCLSVRLPQLPKTTLHANYKYTLKGANLVSQDRAIISNPSINFSLQNLARHLPFVKQSQRLSSYCA